MTDLGRQIGDHARATAEASPRSTVGDVIQPGQPIPDDVTWVEDEDRDVWTLTARGHWHFPGNVRLCDDGRCAILLDKPADFAPLTVTAVREQPMPRLSTFPEEAQYWTDDVDGDPAIAVREQPAESVSGLCEVGADRVTCIVAAPDHRRIYHGGRAAEPEPQQADEPALLDLVRQYGVEEYRRGGGSSSQAEALFARIAALVPQQPDPMVLRLPEVPEGTVALVVDEGDDRGKRYIPVQGTHYWNAPETGGDARFNVLELLVAYKRLRVELAPPREPRTWPKLDAPSSREVATVQGKRHLWRRGDGTGVRINLWCWKDSADVLQGFHPFTEVQRIDGPLTEVLDNEPGGER